MNYLGYEEVAKMLKISDGQARKFLKSENVPSVKIGRKYLIDEDVLSEFLKSMNNKSVKLF